MDKKLAIQFIKSELARLKTEIRTAKSNYRKTQRCVSTIFKSDSPYGSYDKNYYRVTWHFENLLSDFRYVRALTPDFKLKRRKNESDESYDNRVKMVVEFLNTSPYNTLPRGHWSAHADCFPSEVTCLHILYNKLRNKKPHVENEEKYVNSSTYKDILKRVEEHSQISETAQESGG